ncbi:hypothetical protein LXL04_035923 [Taraxacum kok-saghyz]
MWKIRSNTVTFDATAIYEGYPTFFTIELHHGGKFTKFPSITYNDGKIDHVDLVDMDEFSVHELDSMMLQLGYESESIIYYQFQLPTHEDFAFGLRALGNDADVINLAQYIEEHKVIKVYTEHGTTNLFTYFMSPSTKPRVIIEEIPSEEEVDVVKPNDGVLLLNYIPEQVPRNDLSLVLYGSTDYRKGKRLHLDKGSSSCSKKLCFDSEENNEVNPTAVQHENTNGEDSTNEEIAVGVEKDTNEGNAVEGDQTNAEENRNEEIPTVEHANTHEDVAAEFLFDVDNFDPFFGEQPSFTANDQNNGEVHDEGRKEAEVEDEYVNEQWGNVEGHEVEDEYVEAETDGSEEDSDYLVDEENYVSDIKVDMSDFHMSVDVDAEYFERGKNVAHENDNEVFEDVEVVDNDEWDSLGEDSEDDRRKAYLKELGKEKICSHGEVRAVTFHVGQKFRSKKEIKDKVNKLAIESRRNLCFKKNDKTRLRAVCRGNVPDASGSGVGGAVKSNKVSCPWSMQASKPKDCEFWFVKTLTDKHNCIQTRKIRACTAKFISSEILDQVESNPTVPLRAIQDQIMKKFQVGVSLHKVQRVKAAATNLVVGDYRKQYEILRDYLMEIQATNLGTTVKIEVVSEPHYASPTRMFKRVYICLGALKKGFKASRRDIVGLDGAFMKGPFPGQVLTAVGLDSNNGIYPVAYAIVEAENKNSWKWFLECLGDDLELYSNSNFTFISDRQKGILPAIAELYPSAEHRFCLRHIHENMRKPYQTDEYKDHLWKCATATTIPEFEKCMNDLGRAISDILLNNLCEVFNSKLIQARDKPIISCLEFIRQYLMKRICNVLKVIGKATGPLTPTATKLLERNREASVQYRARWSGTSKFEVYGPWHDQHVVDMKEISCTCRRWELNGIPCKHAIATIHEMGDSGEVVGELYTYVNKVYYLDTWKEAYSHHVDPINGRAMWPKSQCPFKLTPPPHHTQPGRPKKRESVVYMKRAKVKVKVKLKD